MKLAIDIQPLKTPYSRNRGIGNYVLNQFRTLTQADRVNEWCFLDLAPEIHAPLPGPSERLSFGPERVLLYDGLKDLFGPRIMQGFIERVKPDIFHATSPFDIWNVFEPGWYKNCNVVSTVYDLIPLVFEDRYLKDAKTRAEYYARLDFIKQSDRIMVISECTKKDIVRFLSIPEERIDVIYAGVDRDFAVRALSPRVRDQVRARYRIKDKFLMCTGGVDFRKNLEGLIEGFSQVSSLLRDILQVVIICRISPGEDEALIATARKFGVADRLILTNYVTKEDLIYLYSMATGFVFPSLYEGFGLPVVEAMACGTPVITSSTSSLREIAEGAAVLVDPYNTREIAGGIEALLSDESLRNTIREKGLERAKQFTWEKVAADTLECYEKLSGLSHEKERPVVIQSSRKDRPKAAFFSPLTPKKSGISDYSEELLPWLQFYIDVDLFVDDYQPSSEEIIRNFQVFSYRSFDQLFEERKYDIVIYQMGNSEFHEYMYPILQRYPGLVVLHDFNLHGLVHHMTIARGDIKRYNLEIELSYGKTEIPAAGESYLNKRVLMSGLGVIVHNNFTREKVLATTLNLPVRLVNMGVSSIEDWDSEEKKREIRRQLGFRDEEVIVASFGRMAATKRLEVGLKSFKQLLDSVNNCRYILVGEVGSEYRETLTLLIRDLQLEDKVQIIDYVPMEEFNRYLRAADVCINLRFPTNGETSASLLRILGAGKPVIITNDGPMKEFPSDCCVKVDIGEREIATVASELRSFAADPVGRGNLGKKARQFFEANHSCEKASKEYATFIAELLRVRRSEIGINKDVLKKVAFELASRGITADDHEEVLETAEVIYRALR